MARGMYLLCVLLLAVAFSTRASSIEVTVHSSDNQTDNIQRISNGSYIDVSAGVNITIICTLEGTDNSDIRLSYPTNEYAKYQRFGEGSRVIRTDQTGRFLLNDLQYYDTGYIDCYDTQDDSKHSSIYLFVYDTSTAPQAQLYVPMELDNFVWFVFRNYVPCLPTNSNTEVSMTVNNQTLPYVEFSKTEGAKLTNAHLRPDMYQCIYTLDGRTDIQDIQIAIKHNLATLPSPELTSYTGRYHMLAGDTLLLNCTLDYARTADFLWSYPSTSCANTYCQSKLTETEHVKSLTHQGRVESALVMTDLHPSDSGLWSCAYSLVGDALTFRKTVSKQITVHAKPFATSDESREIITGKEGDRQLQISVRLQAYPKPTVQWKIGSTIINDGAKFQISMQADGETYYVASLIVHSPQRSDTGLYELIATVDGADEYAHQFNVVVQVEPEIGISYTYGNQTKLYDPATPVEYYRTHQSLQLNCRATKGIPRPEILWSWQQCNYADYCNVDSDKWIDITDSATQPDGIPNKITHHSITPGGRGITLESEVSGWLRCQAKNPVGSTDLNFRLSVSDLPVRSQGIGFTQRTRTAVTQLVNDDSLLLECHVTKIDCKPHDVIVHVQSNSKVFDRNSQEVKAFKETDNAYQLTVALENITQASDGHTYDCRCRGGRQGPPVTLSVRPYLPPSWSMVIEPESDVLPGETRSLMCKPDGRPLPKVTWYKDGEPVAPDESTRIISQDGYNLTILRATPEDAGEYECKASTTRDTIQRSYTLHVNDPQYTTRQKHMVISIVIFVVAVIAGVLVACVIIKRYNRKNKEPTISIMESLLLPSKEMINPEIPLDEQTDALPYDVGWEFPFGNLKIGMLLGQGAFGRVLKAEALNIESGVAYTTVAVKTVRDQHDMAQIKALISELKILIHVGQHLNIVNLLGACTRQIRGGNILVIVEYCRYGNLRSYLLKNKSNFKPTLDYVNTDPVTAVKLDKVCVNIGEDEEYLSPGGTSDSLHSADNPVTLRDVMSWSYQIAKGMEYLASIDYIHRDLAARNVLLAEDNIVKICDFGLAKDVYKYQEYQKQTAGPLPIKWMAVESLTHKIFNVRTDVWAYGVTLWELFSLAATPYPGWEIDESFIRKLQRGERMQCPQFCPKSIYEDVMVKCWSSDPETRPTFTKLSCMMSRSLSAALIQRLKSMEEPYLHARASKSRTDSCSKEPQRYTRVSASNRLTSQSSEASTSIAVTCTSGVSKTRCYNSRTPSTSYSQASSLLLAEKDYENLSLNSFNDHEMDIPEGIAPSPFITHNDMEELLKIANDDTSSAKSGDTTHTGPPSYRSAMKKNSISDSYASNTTHESMSVPDEDTEHPAISQDGPHKTKSGQFNDLDTEAILSDSVTIHAVDNMIYAETLC